MTNLYPFWCGSSYWGTLPLQKCLEIRMVNVSTLLNLMSASKLGVDRGTQCVCKAKNEKVIGSTEDPTPSRRTKREDQWYIMRLKKSPDSVETCHTKVVLLKC